MKKIKNHPIYKRSVEFKIVSSTINEEEIKDKPSEKRYSYYNPKRTPNSYSNISSIISQ